MPAAPLAMPCAVRNDRVRAVLAEVARDAFPPLHPSWRDLPDEVVARLVDDLGTDADHACLVLEPFSGHLPAVLARLTRRVTVVSEAPARAGALAEQLGRAAAPNLEVVTFLSPDAPLFDRVVAPLCAAERPPDELRRRLRPAGRAIWSVDRGRPPRRLRRLVDVDGADCVEDLDLVQFRPLLGDLLVDAGVVLRQEVREALLAAAERGTKLGDELLERGALREDDLYRVLASQRALPFTQTSSVLSRLDRDLVRSLPRKYLDHYRFLPICSDGRCVLVATPDPDLPVWELQAVFDGADVRAELTTPTDLKRIWTAIELGFVAQPVRTASASRSAVEEEAPALEDSRAAALFEAILLDAVSERASDIHLESYDSGARLRFRIDGSLRDAGRYQLTSEDVVALVNVVKIAANLDIAERRAPQGGRVRRRLGGRSLDLRVQTQPTLYHESVVIRILPQDVRPPTIEELGFAPAVADTYRRLLMNPQGLILVVGATGSGKSTTLYAGLQLLAKDTSRKVITIEDPIEYSLAGIQQTQINPAVGFRFADAVRSFVRQDPDVILVGEIRDAETAREAIRAAQTGHLVLATLHCNDTVDAVQRLADLDMHANSIASELTAVVAQRLARRICTSCRKPAKPSAELLAEVFPDGPPPDFVCYEGEGCDRCGGSGTRGRVAVVELLQITPDLRRAISRGAVVDDLRLLAHQSGLRSLRESALELVVRGTIAMTELYDVLSAEQMRPLA